MEDLPAFEQAPGQQSEIVSEEVPRPPPVDNGPSPVWFGYIALGLTLASLAIAFVLLGWAFYRLIKLYLAQ